MFIILPFVFVLPVSVILMRRSAHGLVFALQHRQLAAQLAPFPGAGKNHPPLNSLNFGGDGEQPLQVDNPQLLIRRLVRLRDDLMPLRIQLGFGLLFPQHAQRHIRNVSGLFLTPWL